MLFSDWSLPGGQAVLELGVLAEAAAVAEEGILLVVVDGPALVTLVDILTTVAGCCTHRGCRGHWHCTGDTAETPQQPLKIVDVRTSENSSISLRENSLYQNAKIVLSGQENSFMS